MTGSVAELNSRPSSTQEGVNHGDSPILPGTTTQEVDNSLVKKEQPQTERINIWLSIKMSRLYLDHSLQCHQAWFDFWRHTPLDHSNKFQTVPSHAWKKAGAGQETSRTVNGSFWLLLEAFLFSGQGTAVGHKEWSHLSPGSRVSSLSLCVVV